ncbi:MAG: shikimate dehydrogenase [Phycisphaerae bacterium]|nr:shikimate dehydrogenase [Phycisphaerae bacterium]
MTYLTVSILAKDEISFEPKVQAAKEQGAEAIEIRTDSLTSPSPEVTAKLVAMAKKKELPVIVTCRDKAEGGVAELGQSLRLSILREAIVAGAEFVDIEYENFKHPDVQSVLRAMLEQYPSTQLIISRHNFTGPFEDIKLIYESILAVYPEAIPKIVYKARHINDCFAAFDLLSEADCPVIAFAMGLAGQVSRILAKKFGAFLTFASLDDESASAPGQISVRQMKTIYRWDNLNAQTEIFGLIGNPVGHSLGPTLYNACFDSNDVNAVYVPFLVEGEKLEFNAFLKNVSGRSHMGFGGFSVTIPHKTHALDYANQHGEYVDNLAEAIGAVNTLKVGFNGILSAYNTDYAGAMDALASVMAGDRHDLHAMKVAVIGAGGAARAVVAGLVDVGARVTIYNRTVQKARSLAKEFRCRAAGIDELPQTDAQITINCTSLGMHPNVETCPVPEGVLNADMTVFDTVYNPLETKLLKNAKAAGATIVNGAEMYIRQAMAQYKIFIGDEPNEDQMRQIVCEKLQLNS